MSQFTKKAIEASFLELLNERPLDKIGIKDIVDRCEINRNTFYYYYRDIYALLEEIFQEETETILKAHDPVESWVDGFLQAIHFALENKRAIYHLYHSSGREWVETYMLQLAGHIMMDFVRDRAGSLQVAESDLQIIVSFYQYALVGMIFEWVREGMEMDAERFIRRVGVIFDGNIRHALENCAKS